MCRLTTQDVMLVDQMVLIVDSNIQVKGQESTQIAHVDQRTQNLGHYWRKLNGRSLRDLLQLSVQMTRETDKFEKLSSCNILIDQVKKRSFLAL
jgi:uncharacterized protein YigE (DUF2233 family)